MQTILFDARLFRRRNDSRLNMIYFIHFIESLNDLSFRLADKMLVGRLSRDELIIK